MNSMVFLAAFWWISSTLAHIRSRTGPVYSSFVGIGTTSTVSSKEITFFVFLPALQDSSLLDLFGEYRLSSSLSYFRHSFCFSAWCIRGWAHWVGSVCVLSITCCLLQVLFTPEDSIPIMVKNWVRTWWDVACWRGAVIALEGIVNERLEIFGETNAGVVRWTMESREEAL